MTTPAAQRDELMPRPPPGLGRGAVLALIAHALLIVALAFGLAWRSSEPAGVEAELWAAVPQVAAPEPARTPPPGVEPKPEPKPEPPKAEPEPKPQQPDPQIAIEEEQKREREREKAEREKVQRERAERAEREKAEKAAQEKAARDKAEREKREERRLAELREENLKRMQEMAGGAAPSTGTAARTAGPSAGYAGRVVARLRPLSVFTERVAGNPRVEVELRLGPDGTILAKRIVRSSGLQAWDDAVMRAIEKAETLPRDVDGRVPSPLVISWGPND